MGSLWPSRRRRTTAPATHQRRAHEGLAKQCAAHPVEANLGRELPVTQAVEWKYEVLAVRSVLASESDVHRSHGFRIRSAIGTGDPRSRHSEVRPEAAKTLPRL